MSRQQSAWEIGRAYYDQRDLYTRDARIDAAGYAVGPATHPAEGSYAYPREVHIPVDVNAGASREEIEQRQAWPILNYVTPEEDPYFAFLRPREPGLWERMTQAAKHMTERFSAEDPWKTVDRRVRREVGLALASKADLDATDIEVSSRWAIITLTGTVVDALSKKAAADVAAAVIGVRAVQNHLKIRTDGPQDTPAVFVLPLSTL